MKFTATFFALAAAVLPALAAPAAEAEAAALQKRDNTIYVCTGESWDGQCVLYYPNWNQCYPWSALGLSGLGSWGPSSGTYCILYTGDDCDGTASDTFTDPGYAPVPGFWQYNTQTWKCWW
ncbi:hypothetical protein NM688_g232 [Phlebia brevispora]|uniref:Uncharacterized protein n=1 Tax=Phlebia brevispora TaxID=194682 RepID=A0ACC1TF55_9APHY|nr:hypothetical protein NM688_g232 [Phlebia brevispora]